MATKVSKTTATSKPVAKTAMVAKFPEPPNPGEADAMAKMAMRPSVNAAAVTVEYTKFLGTQDIGAQVLALSESMDALESGDLSRCENMLYGQAHALQSIFVSLARRATTQDYMQHWEAYLRMALKAQNQCRMTLETLATIKNPPVVFARQANINNGGQQQVNNGTAPTHAANAAQACASAHAAKPEAGRTELLEATDGQRMDARATGKAGGADPQLATVGKVHRPAHARGQGPNRPQR